MSNLFEIAKEFTPSVRKGGRRTTEKWENWLSNR